MVVWGTEVELPGLTHAELLRRIQKEIAAAGSCAAAARAWGISPQLLDFTIKGQRNIGPKLLKALKLRRITLVVHRYEPATRGPRRQTIRKRVRRDDPRDRSTELRDAE